MTLKNAITHNGIFYKSSFSFYEKFKTPDSVHYKTFRDRIKIDKSNPIESLKRKTKRYTGILIYKDHVFDSVSIAVKWFKKNTDFNLYERSVIHNRIRRGLTLEQAIIKLPKLPKINLYKKQKRGPKPKNLTGGSISSFRRPGKINSITKKQVQENIKRIVEREQKKGTIVFNEITLDSVFNELRQ